jgi:hypothetical protein
MAAQSRRWVVLSVSEAPAFKFFGGAAMASKGPHATTFEGESKTRSSAKVIGTLCFFPRDLVPPASKKISPPNCMTAMIEAIPHGCEGIFPEFSSIGQA